MSEPEYDTHLSYDLEKKIAARLMYGYDDQTGNMQRIAVNREGFLKTITSTLKRLKYTLTADFAKATLTNVSTASDEIKPSAIADLDEDILYDVVTNYTLSNSSKITVDEDGSNKASLKIITGGTQVSPFTTIGNYTLSDSSKIDVTGDKSILKRLVDIPSSVLGYWKFNESTGTTVSDSSGNGYHGTGIHIENVDWVTAKLNNGLSLDGVNEYVNLGTASVFNFERTNAFSFDYWLKTTDTATNGFLLSRSQVSAPYRGWQHGMASGILQFLLKDDNDEYIKVKGNTTVNDGTWHHIACTYDGSSHISGLKIYVDGVFETLTTFGNTTITGSTVLAGSEFLAVGSANSLSGVNFCQGVFDELIIYNRVLTQAEITTRYNSGTGIENFYSQDVPTIVRDTGFVFTTYLSIFSEVATKPTNTGVKYQVSSDDGVTYKWWNGSTWVTVTGSQTNVWYYSNEANSASVINSNIAALASSGTFKFKAFLYSSEGFSTPELDSITVTEPLTYSTDDNLYLDTKDAVQVDSSTVLSWLSLTATETIPTNTDIRVLFSIDGRSTWLGWNGSAWSVVTGATTRTNATTTAIAELYFDQLTVGSTLDVRVFLYTSDLSVTPEVDNLNVIGDKGYNSTATWESNVYDSTITEADWSTIAFNTTLPTGTTVTITARAGAISDLSAVAYSSALSNGENTNLSGRYVQIKVVFASSVALSRAVVDELSIYFKSVGFTEVSP